MRWATRSSCSRSHSRSRGAVAGSDEPDMPRKEIMKGHRTPPRRAWMVMLVALIMASPLLAQRAELERRIHRQILPNGLEVIVVENRAVPLVTIEVDVRNGSFTQGPQFEGLS